MLQRCLRSNIKKAMLANKVDKDAGIQNTAYKSMKRVGTTSSFAAPVQAFTFIFDTFETSGNGVCQTYYTAIDFQRCMNSCVAFTNNMAAEKNRESKESKESRIHYFPAPRAFLIMDMKMLIEKYDEAYDDETDEETYDASAVDGEPQVPAAAADAIIAAETIDEINDSTNDETNVETYEETIERCLNTTNDEIFFSSNFSSNKKFLHKETVYIIAESGPKVVLIYSPQVKGFAHCSLDCLYDVEPIRVRHNLGHQATNISAEFYMLRIKDKDYQELLNVYPEFCDVET